MGALTPEQAEAALDELAAGRRAVVSEGVRGQPALLAASSLLTLANYSAKDLLAGRRARWTVSALCQLSSVGIALLDVERTPVQPVGVDFENGRRVANRLIVAVAGWLLAERLLVMLLRRSAARRPNTTAGLVLAATRPVVFIAVQRLLPCPGRRG